MMSVYTAAPSLEYRLGDGFASSGMKHNIFTAEEVYEPLAFLWQAADLTGFEWE